MKPPPGRLGVQGVSPSGPNTSQPHAKPLCTLLKASSDLSFLYGSLCLEYSLPAPPPRPSLPSEFLMVVLLGSGVACLLGQGTAPDTCRLCGASMIALFTRCCHYLFIFPTGLGAP